MRKMLILAGVLIAGGITACGSSGDTAATPQPAPQPTPQPTPTPTPQPSPSGALGEGFVLFGKISGWRTADGKYLRAVHGAWSANEVGRALISPTGQFALNISAAQSGALATSYGNCLTTETRISHTLTSTPSNLSIAEFALIIDDNTLKQVIYSDKVYDSRTVSVDYYYADRAGTLQGMSVCRENGKDRIQIYNITFAKGWNSVVASVSRGFSSETTTYQDKAVPTGLNFYKFGLY